ncbi:uncharacterized protein [Dysidea avara]|uniref:uncharacterized protein n=1 Tax=Dysidea avara TaxID=196820 RepID=UPI00331D10C8
MVTIGILSFGTAIPVWYIYDNCIRNKEDKDSSKDKRCFNILSVGSCGFVYVLNLLFDRPSKIKDRDAPDSQNMPLQDKDTNKPVRSAAEEQALYSYARTGPINVVMEGGSSTRPGDKPRQT